MAEEHMGGGHPHRGTWAGRGERAAGWEWKRRGVTSEQGGGGCSPGAVSGKPCRANSPEGVGSREALRGHSPEPQNSLRLSLRGGESLPITGRRGSRRNHCRGSNGGATRGGMF